MRKVVRALRVGDSDNLSDNYWALHEVLYERNFDVFAQDKVITALSENELVYLYWELVHTKIHAVFVRTNVRVLRWMLLNEFMDRKYKRGKYGKKNKVKRRAHADI